VIYGIFLCIRERKPFHKVLLYWLLIFPVPASLTVGHRHALRAFTGAPAFQILSAIGLSGISGLAKKTKGKVKKFVVIPVLSIYIVVSFVNISAYMREYFIKYKLYSYRDWEAGFGDAIKYASSIKDAYAYVYLTRYDEALDMLTAFHVKYPPAVYQKSGMKNSGYRFANYAEDIRKDFCTRGEKALYVVK